MQLQCCTSVLSEVLWPLKYFFLCCNIDGLNRVWPEFICPFLYSLKRTSITCVCSCFLTYRFVCVCPEPTPGLLADPRVHLRLESCARYCSLKRLCLPCDSFNGESHLKNLQVTHPLFSSMGLSGYPPFPLRGDAMSSNELAE